MGQSDQEFHRKMKDRHGAKYNTERLVERNGKVMKVRTDAYGNVTEHDHRNPPTKKGGATRCGTCGGTGYLSTFAAGALGYEDESTCFRCGGSGWDESTSAAAVNERFRSDRARKRQQQLDHLSPRDKALFLAREEVEVLDTRIKYLEERAEGSQRMRLRFLLLGPVLAATACLITFAAGQHAWALTVAALASILWFGGLLSYRRKWTSAAITTRLATAPEHQKIMDAWTRMSSDFRERLQRELLEQRESRDRRRRRDGVRWRLRWFVATALLAGLVVALSIVVHQVYDAFVSTHPGISTGPAPQAKPLAAGLSVNDQRLCRAFQVLEAHQDNLQDWNYPFDQAAADADNPRLQRVAAQYRGATITHLSQAQSYLEQALQICQE